MATYALYYGAGGKDMVTTDNDLFAGFEGFLKDGSPKYVRCKIEAGFTIINFGLVARIQRAEENYAGPMEPLVI